MVVSRNVQFDETSGFGGTLDADPDDETSWDFHPETTEVPKTPFQVTTMTMILKLVLMVSLYQCMTQPWTQDVSKLFKRLTLKVHAVSIGLRVSGGSLRQP